MHTNQYLTNSMKRVNVNWQILFIFIPILNLWTLWRIKKMKKGLLVFLPINLLVLYLLRKFVSVSASSEDYAVIFGIFTLFVLIADLSLMVYLIEKWSKEWNKKIGLEHQ